MRYKYKILTDCNIERPCRLESISKADKDCSATSIHWIACNLSNIAGTASRTAADDRGNASIIYVKARQAWFI